VLTFNGTDLAFGAYGERWRQLRKICVLELLSAARVRSFQRVREEEVARFVGSLAASASAGAAVDMTKMISRLINDTFVRESIGSRYEHRDEYLDALDTAMRQTSVLTVADLFPSSRLMQMLGTAPRKALACRNRITRIMDEIIREKRRPWPWTAATRRRRTMPCSASCSGSRKRTPCPSRSPTTPSSRSCL
jgi:hypothetical protein